MVKEVVEIKDSPEIMFAKYGYINCFALFIVTNDMSTRLKSLISNYIRKKSNISLFPIHFL